MNKISAHYGGIDAILTFFGMRLYSGCAITKLINLLMRIHLLVIGYYLAFVRLYFYITAQNDLYMFSFVVYHFAMLIGQHVLACKRPLIAKLYWNLIELCEDEKAKLKIKRLSWRFFLVYLILTGIWIINAAIRLQTSGSLQVLCNYYTMQPLESIPFRRMLMIYYLDLVFYPFFLFNASLSTVLLYLHILYCIYQIDVDYHCRLKTNLIRTPEIMECNKSEAICRLVRINMARNSFEKALNVFPFIWFSVLFFACSGNIWLARHYHAMNLTMHYFIFDLTVYVVNVMLVMVVIFAVSQVKELSCEKMRKIGSRLVSLSVKDEQITLLVNELRHRCQMNFTGWSMFVLDKNLILSFLGGLLTFAVLFIQISEYKN